MHHNRLTRRGRSLYLIPLLFAAACGGDASVSEAPLAENGLPLRPLLEQTYRMTSVQWAEYSDTILGRTVEAEGQVSNVYARKGDQYRVALWLDDYGGETAWFWVKGKEVALGLKQDERLHVKGRLHSVQLGNAYLEQTEWRRIAPDTAHLEVQVETPASRDTTTTTHGSDDGNSTRCGGFAHSRVTAEPALQRSTRAGSTGEPVSRDVAHPCRAHP